MELNKELIQGKPYMVLRSSPLGLSKVGHIVEMWPCIDWTEGMKGRKNE